MDTEIWVVLGLIAATVVLLWIGATRVERHYRRIHPPDDYDGMREDRDDE